MSLVLDEPVGIDPRVDVVFLALFGDPRRERVLVEFLNAILAPATPIVAATVIHPFHPARFEEHKSLVLDIRARDEAGRTFQVEMQRRHHPGLDQRILYGWSRVYSDQLAKGAGYDELRPVVSVRICEEDLFPEARKAHLQFALTEVDERFPLHGDIRFDILQLSRWADQRDELCATPLGAWFWFFNEAPQWREIPAPIDTPAIEEAMDTLNEFRTDVQLNEIYRGRLEAERIERSRERALQRALDAFEAERAEKERERSEKERERAEKERFAAVADAERVEKERERAEKERLAAELQALRKRLADTSD